jgi:hypothetical protein
MCEVEEITNLHGEELKDKEIIYLEETEESAETEAQSSKNCKIIRNFSQRIERT